ncbi:MAG: hypothetical protein ACI8RZ_004799 [Myxococcota bacterium]|jgi:hypothetical protein
MSASLQRQLVEAVMTRLQALDGTGHSSINLTDATRTYVGRWGRGLPTSPPIAFVYKLTSQSKNVNVAHSRSRGPRIFVDVWIGKASDTAMHLVALDLEADLLAAFEDSSWLTTTRTTLGLTSLQLPVIASTLFPGHLFAHPDREMVRLDLTFTWRTPCS